MAVAILLHKAAKCEEVSELTSLFQGFTKTVYGEGEKKEGMNRHEKCELLVYCCVESYSSKTLKESTNKSRLKGLL